MRSAHSASSWGVIGAWGGVYAVASMYLVRVDWLSSITLALVFGLAVAALIGLGRRASVDYALFDKVFRKLGLLTTFGIVGVLAYCGGVIYTSVSTELAINRAPFTVDGAEVVGATLRELRGAASEPVVGVMEGALPDPWSLLYLLAPLALFGASVFLADKGLFGGVAAGEAQQDKPEAEEHEEDKDA